MIYLAGYGAPTPPPPNGGYNTPNSNFGTPRPSYSGGISTPNPSYGGGGTIAPRPIAPAAPINGNFNSQQTLSQTFPASNNYNTGNNLVRQPQVNNKLFYKI